MLKRKIFSRLNNWSDKKKIAAGDFKAITDYAKKLREAINLDF